MQMPKLALATNSNPSDLVPSVHKQTPIDLERETPNQASAACTSRPCIKEKTIVITSHRNPERQTTSWFGIEDRLVSSA
jgi:hypothetical protein